METNAMNWDTIYEYGRGFRLADQVLQQLKPLFQNCPAQLLQDLSRDLCRNYSGQQVQQAFQNDRDRNMFRLLCIIANFQNMKDAYQRQGFPEKMFQDVTGDLNVWLNTTTPDWGYPGLSERIAHWFIDILNGNVKQFGRLQCNTYHLFTPRKSIYRAQDGTIDVRDWNHRTNPPNPDLAFQDKVVNLHIPASGKLIRQDCAQSLRDMARFMRDFRPDYQVRAFVCYSWLLSPFFAQHLNPDSNIRKFQGLGHCFAMPHVDEAREIAWRLWGDRHLNTPPERLPQDNSIRRAVAQQLIRGEAIPCGCMVIFPDELAGLPG